MINATNWSSDDGFGRAEPCIRLKCTMLVGAFSCVAEASQSPRNWFNLRFVSCVACAPQSSSSGCESTTRVAYDSVSCFRFNPKQAVGERRGSASSEEFCFAFL